MKYSVENIRNIDHSIGIGPLTTFEQKRDVIGKMISLENNPNWNLQKWEDTLENLTTKYISFNFVWSILERGEAPEYYKEIISYETFMEHNTEKIYRIKTWEELVNTEGVGARGGGMLHIPNRNSFLKEMKKYCGKCLTKEQYEEILTCTGGTGYSLPYSQGYTFNDWMVTDKPLSTEREEKDIIGYKLIKEYPGRSIGDLVQIKKTSANGFNWYYWETDGKILPSDFEPYKNSSWFEPIYKELKYKIEVAVGNPSKIVSIYPNGAYAMEGLAGSINITHLKELRNLFKTTALSHSALPHTYKLHCIWVGCDKGCFIDIEDIDKILNAYKEEYENN